MCSALNRQECEKQTSVAGVMRPARLLRFGVAFALSVSLSACWPSGGGATTANAANGASTAVTRGPSWAAQPRTVLGLTTTPPTHHPHLPLHPAKPDNDTHPRTTPPLSTYAPFPSSTSHSPPACCGPYLRGR